jgi:photosystem II stability/assembly factor-like uncharacterized protein
MSRFLTIFAIALLLATRSAAQIAQWDTVALPRAFSYHLSSDNTGNVYCIGDSTISVSTNDGLTWVRTGAYTGFAQSLVLDTAATMFVGNDALGIFRSTDNGSHWSTSLVTEGCNTLARHSNGFLFAGLTYTGNGKVHRSTNRGTTWTSVQLPNASNSFAVEVFAFGQNQNVYAGSIDGFYKSTDLGISWTQSNAGLQGMNVRQLLVNTDGSLYLYTTYPAAVDALYRSTDDGTSWQRISPGAPYFSAMSTAPDGQLYGTSSGGIYRSTDRGVTWNNIGSVLGTSQNFVSMLITRSGRILVGGYRLFRSRGTATTVAGRSQAPTDFSLSQNFPNPFNPSTEIEFSLPIANHVNVVVYDIAGRAIAVLMDQQLKAGMHTIRFDATGLASGTYFCRLTSGNMSRTRKLLLIR